MQSLGYRWFCGATMVLLDSRSMWRPFENDERVQATRYDNHTT